MTEKKNDQRRLSTEEVLALARKVEEANRRHEEKMFAELVKQYGRATAIAIMNERAMRCGSRSNPGLMMM